jgi:hypothetical protein
MDRVDLEALVVRLVDQVQFRGYGLKHDVDDPELLREFIRVEARSRSLRVCTGVATGDERTVWACRPREDIEFLHPTTEEDSKRAAEAMERAMGRATDR